MCLRLTCLLLLLDWHPWAPANNQFIFVTGAMMTSAYYWYYSSWVLFIPMFADGLLVAYLMALKVYFDEVVPRCSARVNSVPATEALNANLVSKVDRNLQEEQRGGSPEGW